MEITLRAETRRSTGSRPARRLRRQGLVPAVVYGREQEPFSVTVNARELSAALRTEAGLNALINLDVEGGEALLTMAREIQRHPYRSEISHVDFVSVSLTEKVSAEVGLSFGGEPVGVKQSGGIVETLRNTVSIEALPTEIPSQIAVDISALDVGDALRVGDLPAIEGVEYLDDLDAPVVTVVIPAAVVAEEAEEVEEEELEEVEAVEEAEEAEAGDE